MVSIRFLVIILIFCSIISIAQDEGATPNFRADIVMYMKFEETSGTTAFDETNNNNDGTIIGAAINQTGKIGKCYDFDNSTSAEFVSIADNSSISITGEITLSCWFYKEANTTNNVGLIGKYNGAVTNNRSYLMGMGDDDGVDNRVYFSIMPTGSYNSIYDLVSTVGRFNSNEWVHMVCTYIPSTSMKVYINGTLVEEKTTNVPSQIYDSTEQLKIGGYWANSNITTHFNGLIDEPKIYNRALAQVEAEQLYYFGNGLLYVYENYLNDGDFEKFDNYAKEYFALNK